MTKQIHPPVPVRAAYIPFSIQPAVPVEEKFEAVAPVIEKCQQTHPITAAQTAVFPTEYQTGWVLIGAFHTLDCGLGRNYDEDMRVDWAMREIENLATSVARELNLVEVWVDVEGKRYKINGSSDQ